MLKHQVKSIEQVREEFSRKGVSVSGWAKDNKVNAGTVYQVLRGNRKCRIGESHKIAVLLGIKDGEIVE